MSLDERLREILSQYLITHSHGYDSTMGAIIQIKQAIAEEQTKEINILKHKIKILQMNELQLCGDCAGKGYNHTDGCHLCEHERRIKNRIKEETKLRNKLGV